MKTGKDLEAEIEFMEGSRYYMQYISLGNKADELLKEQDKLIQKKINAGFIGSMIVGSKISRLNRELAKISDKRNELVLKAIKDKYNSK